MNPTPLTTIDGQTLLNTQLETPRFVVSSLIPMGLHILGGAPKAGRSWLMLWLCLCVSKGENLWNYQCRKGTALYLCLEDSYERIQSRLLDITDDAPLLLQLIDKIIVGQKAEVDSVLQQSIIIVYNFVGALD